MRLIDLSHKFTEKMPVYPGDPVPEITKGADIKKEGYNDYYIKTGMHVGTHIDAPLHMLENGKRLTEIEIEHFYGNGCLIDARGKPAIDSDSLKNAAVRKGDIVFVLTGFYKKFGQAEYYEKYPEITDDFAKKLVDLGVKIVGVDTPSPDRPPFNIHKLLLKNDVLIIENLTNLEKLLGIKKFEIFAFPPNFDVEGSPVRVVAKVG